MLRLMFVVSLFLLLIGCAGKKNIAYYRMHPQELQKAIDQCPMHEPKTVTCKQLNTLALRLNLLAMELKTAPQEFGKEIIKLQERIAKQSKSQENSALVTKDKKALQERLAIVKWLESPTK